ncbi:MAG: tetratricopeptide repeat protein [Desulfuromonadales bacterium]|nr:tetratricopeptide repeat protein [Desulfuromonadales bacterium]
MSGCALPLIVGGHSADTVVSDSYHSAFDAPESKSLYFYGRARLQLARGDLSAAFRSMQQAVDADPESIYLRKFFIELALRSEAYPAALEAAEIVDQLDPDNLETLWQLGTLAFRTGHYQDAVRYFERLVILSPEIEKPYIHLALAYDKQENFSAAEATLRRLLKLNPATLTGRMVLARILLKENSPAAAEKVLREILTDQPDYEPAVIDLAMMLNERGEFAAAERLLNTAINSTDDSTPLRRKLIDLYIERDLRSEAKRELKLLLVAAPLDLEAHRKLGLLEIEDDHYQAAAASFATILAVNPDLTEIRYYYGSALERDERYSEALDAFVSIPEDSSLYLDSLYHRGFLYHVLQQRDAAIATFREIIAHPDARAEVYSALASVYESEGDYSAAIAILDQGLERFPETVDLLYHQGVVLEQMKQRDRAREVMQQVLLLEPKHADALNYVAYSYAEEGIMLEEALRMAQEAYALNQGAHIADTIGWIYFKSGRLEEARRALEKVILELPDDMVVTEHLADICRAMGDGERARALYEKIIARVPAETKRIRQKLEALP